MNADTTPVPHPALALAGVCDCHVHVFGPRATFPFVAERRYTPADATIADYRAAMSVRGIDRLVLTAPSVHGLDNRALLDGLRLAGGRARGVVMVDRVPSKAEIERLHTAGVRGVRTQLKPTGDSPLPVAGLRAVAAATAPWGWHVEVHADVGATPGIDQLFADFPVPVVIEHMGHMPTSEGVDAPGFQALLRLIRDGGWIKLSGAYINSVAGPPYDDVTPYAQALLAAGAERAVWGSNWPHPHQDPVPDDATLISLTAGWLDDATLRRAVLVDNPARLYDFPPTTPAQPATGEEPRP